MPAQPIYHASIEGAQHGAKSLEDFLDYAKRSGASGAQPSNYMLQGGKLFKSAKEIKEAFDRRGMTLDGISAHCPFWVHTSAWTGTRSGTPFIPADVARKSPQEIEKWAENYLLKLMDLAADLGIKIMPMFWGVAFGWELATGYPWGFWQGGNFDLLEEGKERFTKKTARLRKAAN
jgi:sugar phosphate isomerase/epimerase